MSTVEITRIEDVQVGDLVTLEDRRDLSDGWTPDPEWRLTGRVRAIAVTTTDSDEEPYGWIVRIGQTPYTVGYPSPGGMMWSYSLASATREIPEYEPGAVYEVTPKHPQEVKPFRAWYCGSVQYGYFIDAEGDKWRPHNLTGIRRLMWVCPVEPATGE